MAAEPLKIAMIGCGGNARGHMTRLMRIKGVQVVGLCDPAETAVKASQDLGDPLHHAPTYADYRIMLEQVDCDAVEISTPHTQHFDQIMAALDAGKHVLCEKPMVCCVDDAQKVIAKVKQTGRIMGVSYQRHTMAPYRYCRKLIAGGEAGKINFISAVQSQNWYRARMSRGDWRGKMALSGGGQLNDSGSHLLDIVLWMSDLQPEEVFAFQDKLKAEVDILSAMSVKFQGGALCNLSIVGHAVNFFEEITLFAEDMTLGIRGDEVWRWKDEKKEVVSGADLGEPSSNPDLNFVAAIRGEEQIQATPEDALKVIQLSEATWQSADAGAPVKIKL